MDRWWAEENLSGLDGKKLANTICAWWFGTFGLFFRILGIIIPIDFHIFRGVETTNRLCLVGFRWVHHNSPPLSIYVPTNHLLKAIVFRTHVFNLCFTTHCLYNPWLFNPCLYNPYVYIYIYVVLYVVGSTPHFPRSPMATGRHWPAGFRPRHLSGEQHPAGRGAEDFQHCRDQRWAAQDAGTQGRRKKVG